MRPEIQDFLYGDEFNLFEAFGLLMGIIFLLVIAILLLLILYVALYSLIAFLFRPVTRWRKRRREQKQIRANAQYEKRWREALRYPPPIDQERTEFNDTQPNHHQKR